MSRFKLLRRGRQFVVSGQFGAMVARLTQFKGRTFAVPTTYPEAVTTDANIPAHHYEFAAFTHTAVKDGNFADPTVWNTGTVPSGSTAIVNTSTFTVTISTSVSFKDLHGSAAGTLRIDPVFGQDITITCDSIMAHGKFWMGDVSSPVMESSTLGAARVEFVFTQYEDPLATARLGMMTMGPVRIHGAIKSDRLDANTDFPAGATSATVTGLSSSNWRVGDTIIFAATSFAGTSPTDAQYTGPSSFWDGNSQVSGNIGFMLSHDEVRTITAISGNTLTWNTALTYNHSRFQRTLPHGETRDLKPVVTNVSRSIAFRSADPSVRNKRGHLMFSFHDDIQVAYAASIDMGRTDTDPTLFEVNGLQTFTNSGLGTLLTNSNNVRGRYPFHLHGNGAFFGRNQAVLKGLVSMASPSAPPIPGWGITHHNCRASIEQCIVYKVRGAGIVSERGNEIGQWLGNTVMWARGDGYTADWDTRQEDFENHNGHNGTAYESQARQVLQQNNIATSCRTGWMFLQQQMSDDSRVPDQYSLRLVDPMAIGGGRFGNPPGFYDYGVEQGQIPDFNDNRCYGAKQGFFVAHRQFTDRTDNTPMISRRFDCFNTETPFFLSNYSNTYAFYDFIWRGTGIGNGKSLTFLGSVAWHFMFVNGLIEESQNGIVEAGLSVNYEGFVIDVVATNVANPFGSAYLTINGNTDPTTHPAHAVMGPWTLDGTQPAGGYRVKVRDYTSLNSATQLPQPYPKQSFVGIDPTIDPAPGQPRPLFLLDTANSILTVNYNTIATPFIKGWIVDRVGIRKLGDFNSPESDLASMLTTHTGRPNSGRGESMHPIYLIRRNGCFNDAGTWKTPLWFVTYDRLTGEYLTFRVDVTLTNVPSDLLTLHTIDPAAGRPVLPLLPEATPFTALPGTLPAPVIYTAASHTVPLGAKLSIPLRADEGQAKWTIVGGANAAMFEIYQDPTTYRYSLRFLADAGATSGTFLVTVRATAFGATADLAITSLTLASASDNFNRAAENLEASATWTRNSGAVGGIVVNANGRVNPNSATFTYYTITDWSVMRQKVQWKTYGTSTAIGILIGYLDAGNHLLIHRTSSRLVVSQIIASGSTQLYQSALNTVADGNTVEASLDGSVLELRVNGVLVQTVTGINTGPIGTKAGLRCIAVAATAEVDDFLVSALP